MDGRATAISHDVFISYAHIDNQSLVEGQKGWVEQFHQALAVRLEQLLGRRAHIWRDPELEGNRIFNEALINRIQEARIFLSIFSPRYFQSDWCQRELRKFLEVAPLQGAGRVGELARIFKVIKTPVPRETHPESLQKLLGYEFFEIETAANRHREFSRDQRDDSSLKYWAKLEDLAQDISKVLHLMKNQSPNHGPAIPGNGSRQVVFVAETTVDRRNDRDKILRELEDHGYAVLPKQPLPIEGNQVRAELESLLGQACLSVHLIGERFGMVPEGESTSVIQLQQDIAVARGRQQEWPCLIWVPPELHVQEERQQAFLQTLRQADFQGANVEVLEGPLENFKTHLLDRLKQQQAKRENRTPSSQPVTGIESGALTVYLVCDPRDREAVEPVKNHLFDQGFEVNLSTEVDSGDNVRQWNQDNLCWCDASLIFFGVTTLGWLKSQLMEWKKSPGYGRTKPYVAKAVYISVPLTPEKERFRTNEALVLRDGQGFDSAILAPFLEKLREAQSSPPFPRRSGGG